MAQIQVHCRPKKSSRGAVRHDAGASPAGTVHMTTTEEKIIQKLSEIPIQEIEVARIRSDGKNPNRMREEQFRGLVQHIRDNGILNPVIVTESMLLADGEHRVKAAKELGLATVPGRIIPDDDRLRRLLRQAMNKIHGTHDEALDAEEFKALIDEDGIVELAAYLGEDSGDLLKVLDKAASVTTEDNPDDYDLEKAVTEAEKAPVTKPGDKIRLGDHILICGDATDSAAWERLFEDGTAPEMMITDPPYNVAYVGKTKDALTIKNDKMDENHFKQFLTDFFKQAMNRVKGAQYIFMSSSEWPTIHAAFTDAGGYWSTTIIWVKHHFAMGRKDYQTQHEPLYVGTALKELSKKKGAKTSGQPILYGWKKGGTRKHYDTRTETDVWVADKPCRNELHPTMKPVTLYRKAILMSSRPLDIIVDPFCGSGSAIIAAEQTHRHARAIELDPVYCDVIIKRWEEFTGRKAERL